MRLLVLGGSAFLSRAVAAEGVARGHDVTAACRGTSGPLPDGVRHLPLDRSLASVEEVVATLDAPPGAAYDAVVDVARHPSWVRAALAATPGAHWVFVSTINVYPDTTTPGARPDTLPLHEPLLTDEDPGSGPDVYGALKVGCEQLVREGAASSTVVRPGLIVGPGDPTGRFSYWPRRLDPERPGAADAVLAPGDPADLVQVIDVRDLAAWLVLLAERRAAGVFDGVGGPAPRAALLEAIAAGCGSDAPFTWVDQDLLLAHDVQPWMGDRSVPLWLPLPEYAGMLAHDPAPSLEAGLRLRPVAETARDTLAWLRAEPDAPVTGLTRKEERELLDARARRGD